MSVSSYLNYNKIYLKDKARCTINYMMKPENEKPAFDARAFAAWFMEGFKQSPYKSFAEVGDEVGAHRSTIARYAGAKKQGLTDKPSKPDPVIVERLAKLFDRDVDKALMLAGHAPRPLPNAETENDIERIEIEAMYRKRKRLSGARREAFKRILDMVDHELDRLYKEETAGGNKDQ